MKTLIGCLLFVLCNSFVVTAQTFTNSNRASQLDASSLRNSADLINSQNDAQRASNVVFIDQIGDNNAAIVNIQAGVNDLDVVQFGNSNEVYISVDADVVKETVLQVGNNHKFTDFSQNTKVHNLELIQEGNNQNVMWYGGNTISENLKIRMEGNVGQSVIVRNFN